MKLKFRVYDKVNERMVYLNNYHDSLDFYDTEASYYNLQNGDGSGAGYSKPMLYTGVRDKNFAEIYENDIVCFNGNNFEVGYDTGSFMLVQLDSKTNMNELFDQCQEDGVYSLHQLYYDTYSEDGIIYELEVIGNTYAEKRKQNEKNFQQ